MSLYVGMVPAHETLYASTNPKRLDFKNRTHNIRYYHYYINVMSVTHSDIK